MSDDAFASARMAHRAHFAQIHVADERGAERWPARGVEGVPDVQMVLDELRPGQHAKIGDGVVSSVDAIRADGGHDEAMAGENLRQIIIPAVTWKRLARGRARPLHERVGTLKAGHVAPVHEDDQRKWAIRQVRGVMHNGAYLDRGGESRRAERLVAEVLLLGSNGEGSW
jgi:hypothetical protein